MADGSEFLVTLFLGAQLVLCAALWLALTFHERVYGQRGLGVWRASFAAFALSVACGLVVWFIPRTGVGELVRHSLRVLGLVALGAHAAWLLLGGYGWWRSRPASRAATLGAVGAAVVIAFVFGLFAAGAKPYQALQLRSVVHSLLVPIAYVVVAAWAVAPWRVRDSHARLVIATAFVTLAAIRLGTFVAIAGQIETPWVISVLHRASSIELVALLMLSVGWLLELHDVERRRADAATDALAMREATDPATGLPNRARLTAWIGAAIARGERTAIVVVGASRARALRDVLGERAYARMFARIGGELSRVASPQALVARLDEDRIGVALAADPTRAVELARALLDAASRERGTTGEWSLTAGVACSPTDARDAEALIAAASAAQTHAEAREHGAVERFHHGHAQQQQRLVAAPLELRRALADDELELHYQPVHATGAPSVSYYEALVRWRHPHEGLLLPAAFFDLVAGAGLEAELDRFVLERAIRASSETGARIAVNLFASTVQRHELAQWIEGAIVQYGIRPDAIEFEVTEAAVISDLGAAAEVLAALKRLGVGLAIDDFGVGHSSLARLRDLPIDKLKIDRSFVASLGGDARDEAIVRSIVELGRNLGLAVVAEGVESETQLARLAAIGVDYVQGYLIGRPDALPGRAAPAATRA